MHMCTEQNIKNDIEKTIEKILRTEDKDFSWIDDYIRKNGAQHNGLAEAVFRKAVALGNLEYIRLHIEDVELNDCDGYSTYLYETDDEDIRDFLMEHGAFKSYLDYGDCRFAVQTAENQILAFDPDFQKEVFEKYLEVFELSEEDVGQILSGEIEYDGEADIEHDMEMLGVSFEDGKAVFRDMVDEDGGELVELLELLGWECSFEGVDWSLETLGVYFID